MEIKETILKYKKLIIISLMIVLLTSLIMVFTNNSEPEIIEEEIIELVPYKDYEWKNLKHYKKYSYEDDNYESMFGVDVAAHQDVIDWQKVNEGSGGLICIIL